MTYNLNHKYANNYCNGTVVVQVVTKMKWHVFETLNVSGLYMSSAELVILIVCCNYSVCVHLLYVSWHASAGIMAIIC